MQSNSQHILLIDDDTNVRNIITSILEFNGYRVTALHAPRKALQVYRKNHKVIDLVITDLHMPEMTGIDFARKIRQISSDQIILGMSAFAKEKQRQKEYNDIFNEMLPKPFKSQELLQRIKKYLT